MSASLDVLHCSDLHFGHPAVPQQYEAIEALIQQGHYGVVAISGDVSQRARAGEFQRAREFIRQAQKVSQTIVVPGNHDVAWWFAPLGLGDRTRLYRKYMMYVEQNLEPVLRVPGATFVGLNTSHGITRHTLTWNMRDLSIIGHVRPKQVEHARAEFIMRDTGMPVQFATTSATSSASTSSFSILLSFWTSERWACSRSNSAFSSTNFP